MNCKFCNQPLKETDKFCSKCGAEIKAIPANKTKSKLTFCNIASIIVIVIMILLPFFPWLVIGGESYSILIWAEYWNLSELDLWFYIVMFLIIWSYSALSMPSIILSIIKKHKPPVVLPVATSLLAISATIFFWVMTLISGIKITITPALLILLSITNITLVLYNKRKSNIK